MRQKYNFKQGQQFGAPKMSNDFKEAINASDQLFNFFYAVYVNYLNNIKKVGARYEVITPKSFHDKIGDHFQLRNNNGQIEVISSKQLAQEIIDKSPELTGLQDKYKTDAYVCKSD